ncbi:type IV secretion system protein VirB5, partial [Klebsiella pneumoniae]
MHSYKDQLATATCVRDIYDFVDHAKGLKADLEKMRKPGQALNHLLLYGGSSGQIDAMYETSTIFYTC